MYNVKPVISPLYNFDPIQIKSSIIVVVFVTYISRGAVGTSDTSTLTACRGTLQTVVATTASGCAAISCTVASDDTEQLVWCWRKVRHNRDEVLVLCHPPPICLLHIADTQPLLCLRRPSGGGGSVTMRGD